LHDLPTDTEQVWFDLSLNRERRQEKLGYVTAAQARAFLQLSRQASLEGKDISSPNPIATAYLRATEGIDGHTEYEATSESTDLSSSDHDPTAHASRSQELAFLANVVAAGCSLQARPFTAREAFDAAVAICNLGLEYWPAQALPEDFLAGHDLANVFQVGWTVLYKDVCIFVTGQLLSILDDFQCSDRDIQMGLHKLRREMTRHLEAGAPWHARGQLDVIAMLDMPAWAALLGLIDECPVMLANVASGRSRLLSVSTSDFEFISERRQISSVREFMRSLPDALSR
jgi:hypothetical protein